MKNKLKASCSIVAIRIGTDITDNIPDMFLASGTPAAPRAPIPPPLGLLLVLRSEQRPPTLDRSHEPESMGFLSISNGFEDFPKFPLILAIQGGRPLVVVEQWHELERRRDRFARGAVGVPEPNRVQKHVRNDASVVYTNFYDD